MQDLQRLRRQEREPLPRLREMPRERGGGAGEGRGGTAGARGRGLSRAWSSWHAWHLGSCRAACSVRRATIPPSSSPLTPYPSLPNQVQRTAFGIMQTQVVCDQCDGTGEVVAEKCGDCKGAVRRFRPLCLLLPRAATHLIFSSLCLFRPQ